MKKTTVALTVTAFVLLLIGAGFLVGQTFILNIGDSAAYYEYFSLQNLLDAGIEPLKSWFDFAGNSDFADPMRIGAFVYIGLFGLIVPIIWLILIIKFRKPKSLLVLATWFLVIAVILFDVNINLPVINNLISGTDAEVGPMVTFWNQFQSELDNLRYMNAIILVGPHAILALSFLFAIPAAIVNMIYCAKQPTSPKRRVQKAHAADSGEGVVFVREEPQPLGPSSDEIREIIQEEMPMESEPPVVPVEQAPPVREHKPVQPVHASEGFAGLSGPLIVQYINTYGRPEEPRPAPAPAPAPQPVIVPEKIDYAKIRELIRDELLEVLTEEFYEEAEEEVQEVAPQPVVEEVAPEPEVVQVPAPTLDEIRAMVREEVLAGVKKDEKASPIIVTLPTPPPPAPVPVKEPMTHNQVRVLIARELARLVEKEEAPAPKVEPVVAPPPAPAPEPVNYDRVRELIAGELAKLVEKPAEPEKKTEVEPDPLTKEDLLEILQELLKKQQPIVHEVVKEVVREVPVIVKEEVPVIVREEVPVVAPQPEPKKVKEPAPKQEKPRTASVKVEREYERVPFQTRMKGADKEMKSNYNELKSEVLSYGVKSRVSNTGDTFRLHTKTYLKITIAGKSLKLYLALDPKNYTKTTLPVQDASHIGIYEEIPLIFKVKSPLSLKRAKQLIADVMEADNLEQGKVEAHNWVKEI